MDALVHVCVLTRVLNSAGCISRCLLAHRVCVCISFVDILIFQSDYTKFYIHEQYENSSSSVSLLTLVFCLIFLAILVDMWYISWF